MTLSPISDIRYGVLVESICDSIDAETGAQGRAEAILIDEVPHQNYDEALQEAFYHYRGEVHNGPRLLCILAIDRLTGEARTMANRAQLIMMASSQDKNVQD